MVLRPGRNYIGEGSWCPRIDFANSFPCIKSNKIIESNHEFNRRSKVLEKKNICSHLARLCGILFWQEKLIGHMEFHGDRFGPGQL